MSVKRFLKISLDFGILERQEPKIGEEVMNVKSPYRVDEGRSFPFDFQNPTEPIAGLWLCPRQNICPHKTLLMSSHCYQKTTGMLKHLVTSGNHLLLV